MGERASWFILTPEYPPRCGGVGDYVRLLARALVRAGDDVEVAGPPSAEAAPTDAGVEFTAIAGGFGRAAMRDLERRFKTLPPRTVVLVQYTPHGFGWRGMNVPFARFIGARRERLWLMIHEALYPFGFKQDLRHDVLAAVTRATLRLVTERAERAFVSTPAWEPFVRTWGRRGLELEWLPIPATVNADLASSIVEVHRVGRPTVAHFGTYGELVLHALEPSLLLLLQRNPDVDVLLIGRGSVRFAESLLARFPDRAGNIRATGELEATEVGRLLRDSNVALFPFDDGASTRRTSLMSALSVGAAIVTTEGWCSESIWRSSDAVELCDPEPSSVVRAAERLLHDPARRDALRRRARALYERRFHVDRVVTRLQELNGETTPRNDRP